MRFPRSFVIERITFVQEGGRRVGEKGGRNEEGEGREHARTSRINLVIERVAFSMQTGSALRGRRREKRVEPRQEEGGGMHALHG
jgi:hypothetical protein